MRRGLAGPDWLGDGAGAVGNSEDGGRSHSVGLAVDGDSGGGRADRGERSNNIGGPGDRLGRTRSDSVGAIASKGIVAQARRVL